jgi:ATP-binding cassette subfamily F protein 3
VGEIVASGLTVEFGATSVFRDIDFTVGRSECWGVVGRNGSGKTTLFNVIAGRLPPSGGTLTLSGDLRITLLDQHRSFVENATVWDAAASGFAPLRNLERSLEEQARRMADGEPSAEVLARYDRDLERFAREGGYEMDARVDAVLQGLGFDPERARRHPADRLSGGEAGRVGLARQLVAPADVLLLDEPTNHLDLETTEWLGDYLRNLSATVLVISHDRAFLEEVADHVLHFESGTATAYSGSYSRFVEQRTLSRLTRVRAYEAQQRAIARDEEFIRRNIAGQKTAQAQSRRKRLARMPRLSPPPGEEGVMALSLEPDRRGGDQVLVARDVNLKVGERTLLEGFGATLRRGEVVGLVGANGAGKSTLLDAVADVRPPAAGSIELGSSVDAAYYRQDMAQIPLGKTLFDIISDLRPQWDRGRVQGHLGRFGFSGDEVMRKAETLSGGEQSRVALAMLMLSGANFILLDEPTNHLDVESVEALEDGLEGFEGTVLLVSHDRALLRTLVTRVWLLREGRIRDYPGSFTDWEEEQRRRRLETARRVADEEEQRRERERQAIRRGRDRDRARQAEVRRLRQEAEEAEEEVHRLESVTSELRQALADPALYEDGTRIDEAVRLKTELARAQKDLEEALEAWSAAAENLGEARKGP